jgi:hypothetical protein
MTTSAACYITALPKAEHAAAEWQPEGGAAAGRRARRADRRMANWGRVASITRQRSIQVPEPAVRF